MFVELHMIQNFAPSCLNRDDTNSPKDCEFGGFRRARISSQCLKRAIRQHPSFAEHVASGIGDRTKRLGEALTKALTARELPPDQVETVVSGVVAVFDSKMESSGLTSISLYMGKDEVERLVGYLVDNWPELLKGSKKQALSPTGKKLIQEFEPGTLCPDIALFGRMVASKDIKSMNVDAACQVAHAISTHKVSMEMDFFTAVDDLKPDDEPGAGMMGTVEFNSSCFYRYALIDTDQLVENLGGDEALAREAVEAFLRSSIAAIPSARQNSMAAQNPPSFIFAVVRDGSAPWSLVNAFEKPVRATESKGLVGQSVEALAAYWDELVKMYGEEGIVAKSVSALGAIDLGGLKAAKGDNVEGVITAVMAALPGGGVA